MNALRQLKIGCATSVEFLRGLWRGPFWWMVPLIVVLLPAAILFVALQAAPIVAPFVYTVF